MCPHEFIILILSTRKFIRSSPRFYLRIDRGPGAPASLSHMARSTHPPALDTFVITDSESEAIGDFDRNHVEKGPSFVIPYPVSVRHLRKIFAVFQVFSPHYILGAEQCFWLCSCITFLTTNLFTREDQYTRNSVKSKLDSFVPMFNNGGLHFDIKLKQEHTITQLIAEICCVLYVIDFQQPTALLTSKEEKELPVPVPIPPAMEQDWRRCGYTRPLQVIFYACEDPLKTLAAQGLALTVDTSISTYVQMAKWEVIQHLSTLDDAAINGSITYRALACMARASYTFAQNILTNRHKTLDFSPVHLDHTDRSFLDIGFALTDKILRHPSLDSIMETIAFIIGISADGCRLVIYEVPEIITLLLEILRRQDPEYLALLNNNIIGAALHAIRNISVPPEGYKMLNQKQAVAILSNFSARWKDSAAREQAHETILRLRTPWTDDFIESRGKTGNVYTGAVRLASNLLTFDRAAAVERMSNAGRAH